MPIDIKYGASFPFKPEMVAYVIEKLHYSLLCSLIYWALGLCVFAYSVFQQSLAGVPRGLGLLGFVSTYTRAQAQGRLPHTLLACFVGPHDPFL